MARTRRITQPSPNGEAAVVASITVAEGRNIELGYSQQRSWQRHAWDYWERLPELYYPTTQLARLVTQMQWDVTVNGTPLERTDDEKPDDVDDFIGTVTDGIGRDEAIRIIALNIQVAAELFYVDRGDEGGWRVYSIVDPKLSDIREREDWIRIHVKIEDPRDPQFAISPFASIVGPAEELLTLEALSRSQSRSRISQAGILFVPQGAQFVQVDADGNETDPFDDDLQEAMVAPIADEHHPSALVPLKLTVPDDVIEKFRHLTFDRPYDEQIHDRMERVIKRIATGLDIPAEVLLGLGTINHWGQWLLEEQFKKSHAVPLATKVGEVLARAGERVLDPTRPKGWIQVTPDPAELFAKRSTVQDAFRGVDRGAVGLRYVRDAMGAKDEDAPTQDDLDIILAMRGRNTDVPVVAEADEDGAGPEVEPVTDEGPPDEQGTPIAAAIDSGSLTDELLARLSNEQAAREMTLRDELVGAMAIATAAARRRVGAKIRTAIRSTPEHDLIVDVDNSDVAAALQGRAGQLIAVEETVRDSFEGDLAVWLRGRLDAGRAWLAARIGGDGDAVAWREARDAAVATLVDGLTEWTVDQLPRRDAEMQQVPVGLAREALSVAGGSARSG